MDQTLILIAAILALIIIAGFIRYRQQGSGEVRLPGGILMKVKGSNPEPPRPSQTVINGSQAGGNATAANKTGGSASVINTTAGGDINAISTDEKT